MELQVETHGDWKVLTPREKRLDAYVSQGLKTALTNAAADGSKRIVVDLQAVEAIDSSGLGALVFFKQYAGEETRVILASARPEVRSVLALTHLDEVFPIVDRPQQAWEDATTLP